MEKYLVKIEFRYSDAPGAECGSTSKTKTVTIGVYDTFEDACQNGNELHQFPDGRKASKERFSKKRGRRQANLYANEDFVNTFGLY